MFKGAQCEWDCSSSDLVLEGHFHVIPTWTTRGCNCSMLRPVRSESMWQNRCCAPPLCKYPAWGNNTYVFGFLVLLLFLIYNYCSFIQPETQHCFHSGPWWRKTPLPAFCYLRHPLTLKQWCVCNTQKASESELSFIKLVGNQPILSQHFFTSERCIYFTNFIYLQVCKFF